MCLLPWINIPTLTSDHYLSKTTELWLISQHHWPLTTTCILNTNNHRLPDPPTPLITTRDLPSPLYHFNTLTKHPYTDKQPLSTRYTHMVMQVVVIKLHIHSIRECTLYSVRSILYSVHCTRYIVCIVQCIQCTLCSV